MNPAERLAAVTAAMRDQPVDKLRQLGRQVMRYRDAMSANGFSPEAAEQMAVDYHRFVWGATTYRTSSKGSS